MRPPPDPDDPRTDVVTARHVRTLPGWAGRWDAWVLEGRGRRARRWPRRHRWALAGTFATYLLTDALLPRHRVVPLVAAMMVATILDSIATYAWITRQVAVEGNPLVAQAMGSLGDGPGLIVRAALSVTLVVSLSWLARRHWEARVGMLISAAALAAVTLLHTFGFLLVVTA